MRQPTTSRPWVRRGKRASALMAGFGAAALGGFALSLFRRRNPTRYLDSEPRAETVDDTASPHEWLS